MAGPTCTVLCCRPVSHHGKIEWGNEETERLGQALRAARTERGFSQEKLAFTAGITKN